MANHKSAAKRARQSIKKNAVNSNRKSKVRTAEKSLTKAITSKNLTEVQSLLKKFMSDMSKAAQKGVFKKEAASRKIARLSKKVSAALKA